MPALAQGAPAAGVMATVNGIAIPEARLDAAVRVAVQAGHRADTPALRQVLRQQLIVRELLRQNAERAGYGTKPEVQQAVEQAKIDAETRLYLKDNVHAASVTDAQVRARYDEIVASLGKEEFKPRIIVVADAATAASVQAGLKAGNSFDLLARRYSKAPSAAVGGELPWVNLSVPVKPGRTQGLPLAVAQAITQLPVAAISPQPIALGNDGNAPFAIVEVEARRPAQIPAFGDVEATLRQQLEALAFEQATARLTADWMKAATIQP